MFVYLNEWIVLTLLSMFSAANMSEHPKVFSCTTSQCDGCCWRLEMRTGKSHSDSDCI